MMKVKTPNEKVVNAAVRKRKKKRKKTAPSPQEPPDLFCILCRRTYPRHEAQVHIHSMLHHRELETVLGMNSFHECHACRESCMSLNGYAQHISTAEHNYKLNNLMCRNEKPVSLHKTLGEDTVNRILMRNKTEKKELGKQKKKLKQVADLKKSEQQQAAASKRVNIKIPKPTQKKLKKPVPVSSLTPPAQKESTSSSRRLAGPTWQVPDPFGRLSHQASFLSQREKRQADKRVRTTGVTPAVSQQGRCGKPCQSETDFTSDGFPQKGAMLFDHGSTESRGAEGSRRPAPPYGSAVAWDVDVGVMLRQIRRELGIREPCRADREARRQNNEAGAWSADKGGDRSVQLAGGSQDAGHATAAAKTSGTTSSAPASDSTVRPFNIDPVGTKHAVDVSCGPDGPSNDRKGPAAAGGIVGDHDSIGRCSAASEPNLAITRRVRIAHRRVTEQSNGDVTLQPTVNVTLSLSRVEGKPGVREGCDGARRRKQEKIQDLSRRLAIPPPDPECPTQAEFTLLSEGFHWESVPGGPPAPQGPTLRPPPPPPPDQDEPQTRSHPQAEETGAARDASSVQLLGALAVKVELKTEDEEFGIHSRALKRTNDVISGETPGGKRKKLDAEKSQLDQLLAVSMREEELSHSLQELDRSLIQARSALQAAHDEVQRLTLLSQQCTAEVNSLRAQRIQILQEMRGGFAGGSVAAETPAASSASAASADSAGPSTGGGGPPPVTDRPDEDDGNESDSSLTIIEPPHPPVIDLNESDNEEATRNVTKETASATARQNASERGVDWTPVPEEEAAAPSGAAVEDEDLAVGPFQSHSGPVYGLQVHQGVLFTCSGDNTTRAYSLKTGECQAVFRGHTSKIFCLLASPPGGAGRLFTGSDDQTVNCYSLKSQKLLDRISLSDSVFCLHVAWNILFAGLADGSVASHDVKTLKRLDVLECHGPRAVSCLGSTQEGARRVLLVGSYDGTVSVRDAKSGLLLRSLEGHAKTVLCMTMVNDLVFSGSSDASVHAHNIYTGELIRVYKGHTSGVTSIAILGTVMVTSCLDKLVRVYELQSQSCLQVYGGHSGMVMCMAVHQSVMYSGCLDGSVQAVKLNLLNNHRCWWRSCPLIFGVADHLLEHLLGDHTTPGLETVACRWRGCAAAFTSQQAVQQELPDHMRRHVEEDSQVQL
ncbi:zinc finger protein 106 isoform X2 [Antennarius striatus]|uniref:zinc finger protein 106 isoform X2 n=1 Tax=Antennarius striatus TaxID=241820 RepID=UPI0035B056FB